MVKKTGPTNEQLRLLISELSKDKTPFWQRIVNDLNKSTRTRRSVNLSRINRFAKTGETIVVPGKVLGAGELKHKLTIVAFDFSASAKDKIKTIGGTIMSLKELHDKKKVGRIIG
ncbi:MAG: 50S ribosomal protein L18e [Candidatus Nanoarchaeia archaeon]|jgi:large subunit ribosomal protein L18e